MQDETVKNSESEAIKAENATAEQAEHNVGLTTEPTDQQAATAEEFQASELNGSIPLYQVVGISIKQSLQSALQSAVWFSKICWLYLVNHPSHAAIGIVVAAALTVLFQTGQNLHEQVASRQISETSIDQIVSRSRFGKSYSPGKVAKSGAQAFLNVGAPTWIQKEGARAVLAMAKKHELELHHQAALLATVDIESGFNPLAKAPTTTACGLFQFVRRTGEAYGMNQDNCMNPWVNADAGIRHYLDNYRNRVEDKVQDLDETERLFRTFELGYYLHHDGPNSSNPSKDLKAIVLNGTPFLLHVYEVLKREQDNQVEVPSYWDTLEAKATKLLDPVTQLASKVTSSQVAVAEYAK